MSVKIEFSATLDESGRAEFTITLTDLYVQPPPAAPEFAFDYDYNPTAAASKRPTIQITQEAQP